MVTNDLKEKNSSEKRMNESQNSQLPLKKNIPGKEEISKKLQSSGWIVNPYDASVPLQNYSHHALEEYPTSHGPADDALVVEGTILAIV